MTGETAARPFSIGAEGDSSEGAGVGFAAAEAVADSSCDAPPPVSWRGFGTVEDVPGAEGTAGEDVIGMGLRGVFGFEGEYMGFRIEGDAETHPWEFQQNQTDTALHAIHAPGEIRPAPGSGVRVKGKVPFHHPGSG